MTPRLPDAFKTVPLAHRALHDANDGRPENSRRAVEAAIAAGYGIEVDIQPSSDGVAMVFHDDTLDRLTDCSGPIRDRPVSYLRQLRLRSGDETVPTLGDILELVAGRVPLLIEIKDQDGALGPDVGPLEASAATALAKYQRDVAVMSFNPHSVAAMQALLPECPRGLTTEDFLASADDWDVAHGRLETLTGIPDFDRVGASFISHNRQHLGHPRVAELKAEGAVILCWTVRSEAEQIEARRVADNITFEGYMARIGS